MIFVSFTYHINRVSNALLINNTKLTIQLAAILGNPGVTHMCENFRINPEFRIPRLTFYRKSASKCWIRKIIVASLRLSKHNLPFKHEIIHFCRHPAGLKCEFLKFRILEILNFHPCDPFRTHCISSMMNAVGTEWVTPWLPRMACRKPFNSLHAG